MKVFVIVRLHQQETTGDAHTLEYRLIDTHCHLDSSEFDNCRGEVVARAEKAGIAMINSAITPDMWNRCLRTSSEHSSVFASVGLDPVDYTMAESAISWIRRNANHLVGIGETGLDHYLIRDHDQRAEQESSFRKMIGLSLELKLPIQVHSRSSGKRALDVLADRSASNVHMHAFDGKASLARFASHELGYYFSIPTSVVRSPQKRKLVNAVDLEHLLLETDSPVLGPEFGFNNEPANLPVALKEVSTILSREEEEIREIVLENTLRLYTKIKAVWHNS